LTERDGEHFIVFADDGEFFGAEVEVVFEAALDEFGTADASPLNNFEGESDLTLGEMGGELGQLFGEQEVREAAGNFEFDDSWDL